MNAYIRPLAFAVIATALTGFSAAALAQGGGWAKTADDTQVPAFGMSADDVEDLNIVDASGDKIGEVDDVLSKDGTPSALGVEFKGFSDYSPGKDLNVIIPFDQFTLEQGRLKLNADAATVKAMETYPD